MQILAFTVAPCCPSVQSHRAARIAVDFIDSQTVEMWMERDGERHKGPHSDRGI